ncbi:unnamed protein product [Nippostrongylus brasiliensis]|uniref:Uncharacterized protein n=1 Tax=Nippostrongylus brasiliensis TaxID=27835 RepID=A0A0N4XLH7_NIPBR|nr:unnamed protein product [Nippostrongylus brasiliensis]
MLKDRMAKYRLVDSKGAVIEETVENEPGPSSSDLCRRPSSKSTSGVPHLTSHIWGTGPEAIPRSQQKGSSGKPLNVSVLRTSYNVLLRFALPPVAIRGDFSYGEVMVMFANRAYNLEPILLFPSGLKVGHSTLGNLFEHRLNTLSFLKGTEP